MESNYNLQAEKFLKDTNTEFKAIFLEHKPYFDDDKESHDVYEITLKRGDRVYTFKFGQSIAHVGVMPSAYDVLTSLTKYDPDSFEEFCSSYGYDIDSRKAEKIYKAVCDEWSNIKVLYSDEEITLLQEVQ